MRQGITLKDNIIEVSRQCPMSLRSDVDGDKQQSCKKMYLNPAQRLIYNFGSRTQFVRAGRGMGKSAILSLRSKNCVTTIPRSSGIIVGSSIKQTYTILLPNLVKSYEQMLGLVEGIHFFRGQPDKRLGWEKPIAVPRIWENVLAFPNGSVIYFVSTGIPAMVNGKSIQYAICDETRTINWKVYVESARPAIRNEVVSGGMKGWSKDLNPMYMSQFFVSDAGITAKQREWEEEELDQTDDINNQICEYLAMLQYAENKDPKCAALLAQSKRFQDELNHLRCQSKVFMNFSSIHNLSILGEDYIEARRRDMPPLLFDIQILGKRGVKDKSSLFYCNFNSDLHLYSPNEAHETELIYNKHQTRYHSVIDIGGTTKKIEYEAPDLDELSGMSDNCTLDVDIEPDKPFCIAHDFNNNVNTIVTGQEGLVEGVNSAKILSSRYVCNPRMLEDLMEDWCRYYAPHRITCKTVILYYDSTAKQGGTYASRDAEKYKFYNIISRILKQFKWDVRLVPLGAPMPHDVKFEFVNACFAGKERLYPRINRVNNDYLIASLENARTTTKFGRIHKDKSQEKKRTGTGLSEGDELGTNNLTDMSDAFDTLLRGMCKFGTSAGGSFWGRVGHVYGIG